METILVFSSRSSSGNGSYPRRYSIRVTRVMMNISRINSCWLITARQNINQAVLRKEYNHRSLWRVSPGEQAVAWMDWLTTYQNAVGLERVDEGWLTVASGGSRERWRAGNGSIQSQDVDDGCLQLAQDQHQLQKQIYTVNPARHRAGKSCKRNLEAILLHVKKKTFKTPSRSTCYAIF